MKPTRRVQWQNPEDQLPERQRHVLNAVREHLDVHGYPPSRPEIARVLGISTVSTVDWHLAALMKKGWIDVRPDTQRGLRLLREGLPVFSIETIVAGESLIVDEHVERRMSKEVAKEFSPQPDYFLSVSGDSANCVGYADGSLLAVAADADPQDGDLVVACLGKQFALKRFKQIDERHVELCPEDTSDKNEPVIVDAEADDCCIEGVVVGVLARRASDVGYA